MTVRHTRAVSRSAGRPVTEAVIYSGLRCIGPATVFDISTTEQYGMMGPRPDTLESMYNFYELVGVRYCF